MYVGSEVRIVNGSEDEDPDLAGDADHEDDGGPEEAAPEVAVHTVLEPVGVARQADRHHREAEHWGDRGGESRYICQHALTRASNEPSRKLKFHNHGEVSYKGLLLVKSAY